MVTIIIHPDGLRKLLHLFFLVAVLLGADAKSSMNISSLNGTSIHLRAPVLLFRPMAFLDDSTQTGFGGFQIDLLDRIQQLAWQNDGINLTFSLELSPTDSYNDALHLITANNSDKKNCYLTNTADNNNNTQNDPHSCGSLEYDMVIGDYWPTPERFDHVDFTPPYWTTGFASMKLPGNQPAGEKDISLLAEANQAGLKACVLRDSAIVALLDEVLPDIDHHLCGPGVDECARELMQGNCVLFPWDELMLGYFTQNNSQFVLTKERLRTTAVVWPLRRGLDPTISFLIKKYIYSAGFNGVLDELYNKYYSVQLCVIGKSGRACDLPCDPDHGRSNREGECVCDSTRWIGADCSTEVMTDLNLIPSELKSVGYTMFGINALACVFCTAWLHWKRGASHVKISQRFFLHLVLLGCVVSSATILTLGMEDSGDGPVIGCMLSPWMYSVGFCITFGTLFSKLRRIKILIESAEHMRRVVVTKKDTLLMIGGVLLVDVVILSVWTVVSPLQWTRTVVNEDVFGYPLSSVGQCTSDHWEVFVAIILSLHFLMLAYASYLCYESRNISSDISDGKYLALAMISNFQIFLVGGRLRCSCSECVCLGHRLG